MKKTRLHIFLVAMIFLAAAVSSATAQAWSGWKYAPWTGDADSGISSQNTYTVAHCFGNNHGAGVTVNGVPFTESFNTSGTGWSITGNKVNWDGDDNAVIRGGSEDLAEEFIDGGTHLHPRWHHGDHHPGHAFRRLLHRDRGVRRHFHQQALH